MKLHYAARNALLVLLAAVASGASAQGSAQVTLRYAGNLPATHHVTKAEEMFARLVNERTGGKIKVEHYPSGQLFKAHDVQGAVSTGALDIGNNLNALWTKSPIADIADLPFLFTSPATTKRAWQQGTPLFDAIDTDLNKRGIKLLHFLNFGSFFDTANNVRPLIQPQDFKGLRIRSYGVMGAEALRLLGAVPVVVDPSEMYMAMQRGTIDGVISGVSSIDTRKLWEVSKFVTMTSASAGILTVGMNAERFAALPDDVKRTIIEVGKDVQAWSFDQSAVQDEASVKLIRDKGLSLHVMTPAEREQLRKHLQPMVDNWKKRASPADQKVLDWVANQR